MKDFFPSLYLYSHWWEFQCKHSSQLTSDIWTFSIFFVYTRNLLPLVQTPQQLRESFTKSHCWIAKQILLCQFFILTKMANPGKNLLLANNEAWWILLKHICMSCFTHLKSHYWIRNDSALAISYTRFSVIFGINKLVQWLTIYEMDQYSIYSV